jgi:hypothetical protein
MPDERLVRYYENIRQQVEADRPNEHKFTSGSAIRDYAEGLRREIMRRGLPHSPMNGPETPRGAIAQAPGVTGHHVSPDRPGGIVRQALSDEPQTLLRLRVRALRRLAPRLAVQESGGLLEEKRGIS